VRVSSVFRIRKGEKIECKVWKEKDHGKLKILMTSRLYKITRQ
jgi:hypothetical protein